LATDAPTDIEHEVELRPPDAHWSMSSISWDGGEPRQSLYSKVSLPGGSAAFNYEFLDLVLVEFLSQIPLYLTGELVVLDSAGQVLLATNSSRANTTVENLQVP
jgi:hypothetical protein